MRVHECTDLGDGLVAQHVKNISDIGHMGLAAHDHQVRSHSQLNIFVSLQEDPLEGITDVTLDLELAHGLDGCEGDVAGDVLVLGATDEAGGHHLVNLVVAAVVVEGGLSDVANSL